MEQGLDGAFCLPVGPRGFAPNVLVAVDFSDECFSVSIEVVEEAAVAAVAAVHADDVESNAELALVADAFEGDGGLGGEDAVCLGYSSFFASRGLLAPGFGQVEADVAEGGHLAAGKAGADGDLAVFDFAEATDVLARNADGAVTFFLNAAVIDDKAATGTAAKQSVGAARNLVDERAVVPRRVADGVVDALVVEVWNVFFHAFDVFGTAFGLHEAEEVALDLGQVAVTARAKEFGEVFHVCDKTTDRSGDVL